MIGTRLLHYEITEKLGEGGMGVVYKARDTHLDRFVAIKVLPPEKVADRERRRRFAREARAASTLNHPNIVTIFDIAEEGGADFIAMEYVPGQSLAEIVAGRRMPVEEALECGIQIADALAAAHEAGIVHRDLKPGNVMMTDRGRVKLLDFGLAKLSEGVIGEDSATRSARTAAGAVLGTPAYMSPEQVEGLPADARSDIFAFGALLYEVVSGQRAFERTSLVSTLKAVATEEPPPLAGTLPGAVRDVILRCLRKNPSERFQTAGALKAALESARKEGAVPAPPSIAVLPFANLSADKDNEYFSDGLAEEIINALTQLPGLKVTARTSAFAFRGKEMDVREIGAKLGVDHILEGSVRKAGDRIRVTAQLIKAADGYHLWSERFDRAMTDVFEIQDEIAAAIVDKLRVRLAGTLVQCSRTTNMEAYNLLLKARHFLRTLTSESLQRARNCLEESIALDKDYAPTWCQLADYHFSTAFYSFVPPRESMPKVRAAAARAVELNPNSGEAHAFMGTYLALYEYDWSAAERAFERAVELDGESPLVRAYRGYHYLRPVGRLDEAVQELAWAISHDPLELRLYARLGYTLHVQRKFEEAVAVLNKALELRADFYMALFVRSLALGYGLGRFGEALADAEKAVEVSGRNTLCLGVLALVAAQAGRTEHCRRLLAELHERACSAYVSPAHIAWPYIGLHDADRAFEWCSKAIDERDAMLPGNLNLDAIVDWLRPDPRFRALCARMNLECG